MILELIEMAKQMRDAPKRGEALGLTDDELAFYDALIDHGGVKEVMADDVLAAIAHDLVDAIRRSVTIDWTVKEAVRANMRRKIKRLLRKHGYPPDKREEAIATVLEQAEQVCKDWAMTAPPVEEGADKGATPTVQSIAPAAEEGATPTNVVPLPRVAEEALRPFENAVPVYDLKVAAGGFSDTQLVDQASEWVSLDGTRWKPAPDLFVARVVGESMNRRIPNGAWCLWKFNPGGTRNGKVVLAQLRGVEDPETGGRYTVKVYESELVNGEKVVRLKPDSTEAFGAIRGTALVSVLAELVARLPSESSTRP